MNFADFVDRDKFADLLYESHGPETVRYAKHFDPSPISTDFFDFLVANKHVFENKTVVDLGANNGFWGWMCLCLGARSVICVEPRTQFVNGVNTFAVKHSLPITAYKGTHADVDKYIVDNAVLLCSGVPSIFDFPGFVNTIKDFDAVMFRYRVPFEHDIQVNNNPGVPHGACMIHEVHVDNSRNQLDMDGNLETQNVLGNEGFAEVKRTLTMSYTSSYFDTVFGLLTDHESHVKNLVYFAVLK